MVFPWFSSQLCQDLLQQLRQSVVTRRQGLAKSWPSEQGSEEGGEGEDRKENHRENGDLLGFIWIYSGI